MVHAELFSGRESFSYQELSYVEMPGDMRPLSCG